MPDARELEQLLVEADDIARSAGQALTSAHLLLAIWATPSSAAALLGERGTGSQQILDALSGAPREPASVATQLLNRTREIAAGVGVDATSLHLLIAISRSQESLAYALLERCGVPLAALRNTILSWYTGGKVPKHYATAPQPLGGGGRAGNMVTPAPRRHPPLPRRDRAPDPDFTSHDDHLGGGLMAGRGSAARGGRLPPSPFFDEDDCLPERGTAADRLSVSPFFDEDDFLPERGTAGPPASSRDYDLMQGRGAGGLDGHLPRPPATGEDCSMPEQREGSRRPEASDDAPGVPREDRFSSPPALHDGVASTYGAAADGRLSPWAVDTGSVKPPPVGASDDRFSPSRSLSLDDTARARRGSDERLALAPGRDATRRVDDDGRLLPRRAPDLRQVQLDAERFPLLSTFGRNLTVAALRGRLDPVIGREREVDEVVDILGKRRGNNPVLVGEAGVGKTSIVEGVAQRLVAGDLDPRILVELDMASLTAGTSLRGSFSERLGGIKEEVRQAAGRVLVFIDELHTVVGAGSTGDGPQDAANELKTALARGEFPCIGATTHDEYRKFIEADPALERRFTAVQVPEPSPEEAIEILRGIAPRYEQHHGVRYEAAALRAAATLTSRYIRDRQLPDKAIQVMDLAGSRSRRAGKDVVDVRAIADVVARTAKLPLERLITDDAERLLRLEDAVSARVVGHGDVISRIAGTLRRNYAGFSSHRPLGSFLFLGPTGVGKTEMAKAIAEILFGEADALIRIDMSELAEPHGVARLIGAPPGYVGHGEGGQLTEAVRRRPASVVLLDEIEKAHRDVQLLLLQILDEGRLTDAKARLIDFSQTMVILTSNLGGEAFTPGRSAGRVGFAAAARDGSAADDPREERALSIAREQLPLELWNRIDERCLFHPLERDEVAAIARLLLADSSRRLEAERDIRLQVNDEVIEHLVANGGYDVSLGARPMRQLIQRVMEAPLADSILRGGVSAGDTIEAVLRDGAIVFDPRDDAMR